MEIGDIKNELTCWVRFGDDAYVLLRYITRDELNKIRRKATKRELIKGQMFEDTDIVDFSLRLGRIAVLDWRNLTMKNELFEYNSENRDLLMKRCYEFNDFVQEKCIEITNFIEAKEEESKKKLEPIPDGA